MVIAWHSIFSCCPTIWWRTLLGKNKYSYSFHLQLDILISSFKAVLSSPCVWCLILTPHPDSKIMYFHLPIFVSLNIFILNIVHLSAVVIWISTWYPANTLNVMFEYKFLILFSKTTFHLNFTISVHGIAIFFLVLNPEFQSCQWLKSRLSSMCLSFNGQLKMDDSSQIYFSFLFLLTLFFFKLQQPLTGLITLVLCSANPK